MTRPLAVLAAATLLIGVVGCGRGNYTTPERYERGLVVVLSGAGSLVGECNRICHGLNAGGAKQALEVFEWSSGKVLADQSDVNYNRGRALDLAHRIGAYQAEHPGRPVHLVGLSAGTGVVVWTLEYLSEPIEGAVLLASSLDTHYDLTAALLHVNGRIHSFSSFLILDPILGIGVPLAGTVDRSGGVAGGLVGFKPPEGASDQTRALYKKKLEEHPWWPGDLFLGNLGDHLGTTSLLFVQARIAPLVVGKESRDENPTETAAAPPAPGTAPARPPALRTESARAAEAEKKRATGRFFNWSVGDAAASRPANPENPPKPGEAPALDDSKLFETPGHLP
jgi:hypothetical protein